MKKVSLILASVLLLGGISFASPVVKQPAKASASKQASKPAAKKAVKKSSSAKKSTPMKKAASAPAK